MKIFIEIKDNKLNFRIRKRLNNEQKNLLNTNIISQNELVFSDEYLLSNKKLVASFLRELVKEAKIKIITIREYDIAPLILGIIKYIPEINTIYFLQETTLTFKICEMLINNSNIKYVSVYNIQTFMLDMLDQKNIQVDSRNEILFSSNFMTKNNLNRFSTLYYKKDLILNFPLSENDEEDFLAFCKINKYLKTITINKVKLDDIEYILKVIKNNNLKNIKIIIKDNVQDPELVLYLKRINKENKKYNKIKFKISYSEDYLKDNMINQLKINTIKSMILIVIIIIFLIILYVFISNYNSMQKVESIQKEVISILNEAKENINEPETNDLPTDETEEPELKVINKDLEALKEINNDVVGWLKVNNTNVDYPVVQGESNDYYLDKNLYKEKDPSGWIFMDYRNNPKELSQNTIIFGHNMYYSGIMFGTLYKTKQANWYTNLDNQIITFNTLYENIEWRIFSIYALPVTNDYLIANFSTEKKYQNFLNTITERSIYNFGVPVRASDKILTLSTCSNNGKNRLVIHAVRLD